MLVFSALLCTASCAMPYKIDTICLVDSAPNANCDRLAELYTEEFWNKAIPGSWPEVQQYLGTLVTVTADQASTAFSQTKSPYVSVYVYTNGMSLASPMSLDPLADHTVLSFVGQQQSGLTLSEQDDRNMEAFMHQLNVVARLNKNVERGRQIDTPFVQTLIDDVLWPKLERSVPRRHFRHKLHAAKLAAEPTITLTATDSDQRTRIDALLSIGCNLDCDTQLFIPYCAIDDPNKLGEYFAPTLLVVDSNSVPFSFQPKYLWTNVSFLMHEPVTNITMNETHWHVYTGTGLRLLAERYPADLTCLIESHFGDQTIVVNVVNFPPGTNATGMNITILPEVEFQLPFPFKLKHMLSNNVPSLTLRFASSTEWDSMVTGYPYPIFGLTSEDVSKITVENQPTHCHIFKSQYIPPVRPNPLPGLSSDEGTEYQSEIVETPKPPDDGNNKTGIIVGVVVAVIVVVAIVVVVVVCVVKNRKARVYAETSGDQPLSTNEPPASTGDQPAPTEDKEPSVGEPEAPASEHQPSIGEQDEPPAGDRPPSPNNVPPETDDNPQ